VKIGASALLLIWLGLVVWFCFVPTTQVVQACNKIPMNIYGMYYQPLTTAGEMLVPNSNKMSADKLYEVTTIRTPGFAFIRVPTVTDVREVPMQDGAPSC